MLSIDTTKVAAVLMLGTGWTKITIGSFTIDNLEISLADEPPEAEDYGFSCIDQLSGQQIIGRLSALLAVRE